MLRVVPGFFAINMAAARIGPIIFGPIAPSIYAAALRMPAQKVRTASMTSNRIAKLFLSLTLLIGASAAIAQPATAIRDGSHDFDFSRGSWTTDITIIKDPFNKPDAISHMHGTKVARPLWNGKGWIEEIEADGPGGHWEAANVFLYDPVAGQWSENYVDSSDGKMDRPNVGGYRDGKLEFYSLQAVGARTMLVRGTWTISTPDLHSYEVAQSTDGGRTWHTSFIARVTRAR
jgi:hypothetical protein